MYSRNVHRPSRVASLLVLLLTACGRTPADQRPAPNAQRPTPNIVLITIDTLRADRFTPALMPALTALGARGVVFGQTRSVVPLTLPAHVSLMTGALPPAHGVRENGIHRFDRRVPTIAEVLHTQGYDTAAFVGAYVLDRRFGLNVGFATYDDHIARDPAATDRLQAERRGDQVMDAALAWLASRTSQASPSDATPPAASRPAPSERGESRDRPPAPFFLWIHLYDPHAPYTPPAEFLQKAGGRAYDGEVAFADAQVARLVSALDAAALGERTAIVVTGDHGESLGEHGEQTHGMLLYEAALRVPLIVSAPGLARATRDDAVSLVDVAPAILQMAASPVPGTMTGRSVLAPPAVHDVFAETEYPRVAGWSPLAALVDDRWKVIRSSGTELYDLRSDPGERTNLASGRASAAQAMADRVSALGRAAAAPAAAAQSPEVAERLRALGYVASARASPVAAGERQNPAAHIATWVTFERALAELEGGKASAAAARLRPLAEAHPRAQLFASTYAQALAAAGQPRAAVPIYRTLIGEYPQDAMLYHALAVAARDGGLLDEAERAERAAIALDPALPTAHNGLGLVLADRGREAEAVPAFAEAVTLDSTNAGYWTNLGNARRAAGDLAGAEAAYRDALRRDANDADAGNGLGALLVQAGRAVDAVPILEAIVARDPSFIEARLNFGIALQQAGQPARAAEQYRAVLKAPARHAREREAAAALLNALGR